MAELQTSDPGEADSVEERSTQDDYASAVGDEVVLDVRNLVTEFTTKWGISKPIDRVSYSVRRGETLGVVGESGSGKSVTALSILRLLPSSAKIIAGEVFLNGRDLMKLSEDEMREIRGGEISMILQDPMQSLNPLFTVGNQVGEAITIHRGLRGQELHDQIVDALKKGVISLY